MAGQSPVWSWSRSGHGTSSYQRQLEEIFQGIRQSLEDEPLEDGVSHAAEGILRQAILDWKSEVATALMPSGDDEIDGSLMQCLGRLESALVLPWALDVARACLQSHSARVRGAAVKAIELWDTPDSLSLLRDHKDQAPWLTQHVERLLSR